MKLSEAIKTVLAEGMYVKDPRRRASTQRVTSPFMCHAIEYLLGNGEYSIFANESAFRLCTPFMDILKEKDSFTLASYLEITDLEYKVLIDNDASHWSQECFDIRVRWWNNLIIDLEAKGL